MRWIFIALAFATLAGATGYFWRPLAPKTPEALFAARCATCHALPDLEGYSARERRGIVWTMLAEKGADEVISPKEARKIIDFITATVSPKDQSNGDT